jgi:N,N'-diacetylchitobiose transport system permease protein
MTTATPTRGPVRQGPGEPRAPQRPTARRRPRRGTVAATVAAVLVAVVWVFPVYWMVNSSLLPRTQLQSRTPTFFSLDAGLFNFARVLDGDSFLSALRMSLVVTLSTVVLVLVFAFLAALAISRFRFRGRKSFVVALLFIQMLPAEGLFIAQYRMLSGAELLNTAIGVTVLYTAAVVPFTVWMLRGFVAGVPAELEEAAMVDGLSRTGAFVRITFPLLAPGLVAAGVYAFLQAWNEFTIALVALPSNQAQTLPLWLRGFLNSSVSQGVNWGEVMAASTLIAVPVIVFFLVVQGRMTGGLVSGAVKG